MKVYKAIAGVMSDLASTGIGKDSKNQQQGFAYRGIDAVMNALAPLLVKHGLLILPRYTSRNVQERVNAKGTALFYVTVAGELVFTSVEDGSTHTVAIYGEAMDSGDKATNKAMSIAYKYGAFQAFCIPTEAQDPDAVCHDVQPKKLSPELVKSVPKSAFDALDTEEQAFLQGLANEVSALIADDVASACEKLASANLDADEKAAIWCLFDSAERSAMKKHNEQKKAA